MPRFTFFKALTAGLLTLTTGFAQTTNHLASNTVLIIRHAEKPASGTGLDTSGEARAKAYIGYFRPFREADLSFSVDALYAGADSANSFRPRLTLEPLSKASGLPLHADIGTKDTAALVQLLKDQPHGTYPLIAWRHGELPALLEAFGASPTTLLPQGKWPASVFDWVVALTFDAAGHLVSQRLIQEKLSINPVQ